MGKMMVQLVDDNEVLVLSIPYEDAFDEYGEIREEYVEQFENYTTERFIPGRHVGYVTK